MQEKIWGRGPLSPSPKFANELDCLINEMPLTLIHERYMLICRDC